MSARRIHLVIAIAVITALAPVLGIATTATTVRAGPELVANGSFETLDSTDPTVPSAWARGGWGSNTRTFSILTSGAHTGSRSARVVVSGYVSGDAKWWFAPVAVSANTSMTYRDWYRSGTTSLLVAEVRSTSGATSWMWLANLAAATAWTPASATFTAPPNAAAITVYHLLAANGTLDLDDVSLATTSPAPPTTSTTSTTTPTTTPTSTASTSTTTSTTTPPTSTSTTLAATTTTAPPSTSGLVANPSVEVVTPSNATLPQSWTQGGWGTNSRSFTYPSGDAHTGSRFVRVTITSRSSGDAKWCFADVPVTSSTTYTFRDWYRSNVSTQLVAEFHSTSGTTTWSAAANVAASAAWASTVWTFTPPAGTATMTVYHLISSVGWLDTDDTTLSGGGTVPTTTVPTTVPATTTTAPATTTTAPGDDRPTLYLTFDDGPGDEYTAAMLDMLDRHGVDATFFVEGRNVRDYPWETAMIVEHGNRIGNHSDTHPDFTRLTASQIAAELRAAEDSIAAAAGVRPRCVRPPYGYVNTNVYTAIANLGLSTVLWTHDTVDWDTAATSVQDIIDVLDTIGDRTGGAIVLMHDFAPNTIVALDRWLDTNDQRFDFRSLPQC